ncbi:MAG: UDP-N-acetylmuramate--L-alanine ligase [Candidatus Solibacter usitatus]|nr:UDP-N-acetylmuramate--L-alanine ligase [Candidatus Solibacter usitatus]
MFLQPKPLHFTGIGGIGMSGLAEIFHALGWPVTGSDAKLSPVTGRLARLGIAVSEGHCASNLPPAAAALIVTSALNPANPEVAEARRRGLPIVSRGELLAEFMRGRRGVAVGGSHGKTTTSSMAACIAIHAGLDPTVFVGTLAPFLGGSNVRLGGDVFIAECDESDGSFLELAPFLAIITNVDREHLDYYGNFDNARAAFVRFANRTSFEGAVIACVDDEEVRTLLPAVRRRVITYGHAAGAALHISEARPGPAGSQFTLHRHGEPLGRFSVGVPGVHNILNAAAAIAVCLELGVPVDAVRAGLAAYRGTGRRMEFKGSLAGITVIDDYGHHPTEVRATLDALRLAAPRRLFVVFQPHRYTRTQNLMDEFAGAFAAADVVRLLDIYAASEEPIPGVTAEILAARITAAGHPDCRHIGALPVAVDALLGELRAGDLVLTLGAGSVTQAGPMILEGLGKEAAHGPQIQTTE